MIKDIKQVESKMLLLEEKREKVLSLSREIIRNAGKSITAMHAKETAKAKALVKEMEKKRAELSKSEQGFEYNSLQAHQEYVEAKVLSNILMHRKIPSIKELKESEQAYVLGLMDVVGELKRETLDSLLNGNVSDADAYYTFMVEIYDSTLHLRFANAILPDFRRKQDSARIQVENTANELLRAKQR